MANFLLSSIFRITVSILNFVSPSIVVDILLHPFDFATVLLQIGYNPEANKCERSTTATLLSVILQYAIFTFYIPYLLTSMQGLQFMGMPHPSIFYYVNYIYNKEGFRGCYRGLKLKICERLIMVSVNERVRRSINKGTGRDSSVEINSEYEEGTFLENIINAVCSQFFAILASHPFHVMMVSSFAEFTYNKKSSLSELFYSIYKGDGYFGFFTGLTARLLGELLSLIFSVTYTTIINKQMRTHVSVDENPPVTPPTKTANLFVNYVTDVSRFTAFKPHSSEDTEIENSFLNEETERNVPEDQNRWSQYTSLLFGFLRNLTQHSSLGTSRSRRSIGRGSFSPLLYIPLTSKLFYYVMIRDFLSKKISNPFFLVCHCSIVLDAGWDNFPLLTYLNLSGVCELLKNHLTPMRRIHQKKPTKFTYY